MRLQVLPFDHDFEIELLCSIGVFEIKENEQKNGVKNILKALLNINVGKYHAAFNNCRHFVRKAVKLCFSDQPECSSGNLCQFETAMSQIEAEDEKFIGAYKRKLRFSMKWCFGTFVDISIVVAIKMSEASFSTEHDDF